MGAFLLVILLAVGAGAAFMLINRPKRIACTGDLPPGFPADDFSHAAFEALLRRYVSADGKVDYARWQASPDDVRALQDYLAAVAQFSPFNAPERFADRSAELAYWMYAYNAYVIKSVLDHWPVESVTDVKAPLEAVKGLGFFYRQRFSFGGKFMSLFAVENDIIRPRYQDPRVHFVLSCASESCPAVQPTLPVGEALESLLDRAAEEFLADPKNVSVDHAAREIRLSKIFKWYRRDFVSHSRLHGVANSNDALDYILANAPPTLAQALKQASGYAVRYDDYDWALNETSDQR